VRKLQASTQTVLNLERNCTDGDATQYDAERGVQCFAQVVDKAAPRAERVDVRDRSGANALSDLIIYSEMLL